MSCARSLSGISRLVYGKYLRFLFFGDDADAPILGCASREECVCVQIGAASEGRLELRERMGYGTANCLPCCRVVLLSAAGWLSDDAVGNSSVLQIASGELHSSGGLRSQRAVVPED